MEDRSKELEKKETEKSGLFKKSPVIKSSSGEAQSNKGFSQQMKALSEGEKEKKMEDLLSSYGNEDLAIDENEALEEYTMQKIALEWLNWNAQFFDYSNEPYLFSLAEILSKDFLKDDTQLFYQTHKNLKKGAGSLGKTKDKNQKDFNVYSPFQSIVNLANLISQDKNLSLKNLLPSGLLKSSGYKEGTKNLQQWSSLSIAGPGEQGVNLQQNPGLAKLMGVLASKDLSKKVASSQLIIPNKALGQRNLRREYAIDNAFLSKNSAGAKNFTSPKQATNKKALNYLDFDSTNENKSYLLAAAEKRDAYSRKQTQKAFQEEESKKVFVVINSSGGSVGNGITIHDALQFIKAGSLTLGLGVAASAASLVLAGGTISERYVTEGCHVMIHQPASSMHGQASDMWLDSQQILKIRLDVAEIYSLSAYRPRHKILRDLDRDFYLTATETIQYGIADEIATNDVLRAIVKMTSKVWSSHDSKQQQLLETQEQKNSGIEQEVEN